MKKIDYFGCIGFNSFHGSHSQHDHRLPVLDADEGLVITSTKSQNHCAVGASAQSSRAAVDPLPNPHR